MLRWQQRVHSCDKTAQLRVSADWAVSNCLDRNNFATNPSEFFCRGWSAHDDPQTLQTSKQAGIARCRRLPKGWARAGAFSLLTRTP